MILSVSTLIIGSGAAMPVSLSNFCMDEIPLCVEPAHVGEMTGHRGGDRHHGTQKMRPSAAALPAFEIPVGRGSRALAGSERVGIHPQTHGASGVAPLKAGLPENTVEPSCFRGFLYR